MTFEAYEQDLYANVADPVGRLKTQCYRAKLVQRCYIPKASDKQRASGIPALKVKLIQKACARTLIAIYEQDFLPESYGNRPNRDARSAVEDLTFNLQFKLFGYLVEADIKGYFDQIPHAESMRSVARRISDRHLLALLKQWLDVPVEENDM